MQAIILAAGMGKRLGELTRDNTKCMLEVNGIRLIDRTLESLHAHGVSRVVLVVGYQGRNVKDYLGSSYKGIPIIYVDNPDYSTTNNIYSLFLAKDLLVEEDTLLLESDLIFDPEVLTRLVSDPFPNVALVDKYESWMDGTVVTLDCNGRITRFIDKEGFRYDEIKDYYKTVNIYKFSKEFLSRYYVPFLEAYCRSLGGTAYYEQVLRILLHLHEMPLKALPLSGETWYEIDDIQDLDIAKGMFAPSDEEHFRSISSRYGGFWRYPQMLDFCYLVNPYFPSPRLIDEMKASFETLLREYPSGMRVNALLAAKNFGVKQEHIMVGNGAAELIKALMEEGQGRVGYTNPTFEEYPNRLAAEQRVPFVPATEDFSYTAEDLMGYFSDKQIDTLLLVNPDNPSGNFIPFDGLVKLVGWTREKGIRLIVDESFVDFAKTDSPCTLIDDALMEANPHLTVIKSISKAYGVPGLRLGILASGDKALIERLKRSVSIWNINSFGEFYMQIYEKYHADYLHACQLFQDEREHFFGALSEVPYLKVYSSQSNYFLCRVTGRFSSHELALKLLRHNIIIKDCSTKAAFGGRDYIRLAVRSRDENERLVRVLKSL